MIAYISNNSRFLIAAMLLVVGVPFAMGLVDFDSYDPSEDDLNEMKSFALERPSGGSFGKDSKYKYYGNGEVIDVVSVENHTSGAARSRVVYDIKYYVLEDLYIGNAEAKVEADLIFTKKYSEGESFVVRQAMLLGRDMDTFGSPKRPYEFRSVAPVELLSAETIPEAQLLKDYRVKSQVIHRLLLPRSFLDSMVSKDLMKPKQIVN